MTDRSPRAQPRGRRVDTSTRPKRTTVSKRAANAAAPRAPAAEPRSALVQHPTEARGTLSPTGMERDPLH
jgi:hypothetical protein